mgnify:CR=1 FL=1
MIGTRWYQHVSKVIGAAVLSVSAIIAPASAEMLDVEKDELKLGFIKLTDMAPLAIAYEKGYFEDEGLFVTLEPQANWKVLLDGVLLRVGGPADHVNRRVTEWLKSQARDRLIRLAPPLAAQIGRQVGQIRVADPRTRWGSCSGRGTLSFNWRLVLAPEHVFDYVCAHEVAHLKHMDHSPAFWAVVARLHDDPSRAQAWLKDNGRALRGWG